MCVMHLKAHKKPSHLLMLQAESWILGTKTSTGELILDGSMPQVKPGSWWEIQHALRMFMGMVRTMHPLATLSLSLLLVADLMVDFMVGGKGVGGWHGLSLLTGVGGRGWHGHGQD